MSELPEDLKYTQTHEWVRLQEDGSAVIGITDHAQQSLGELVFVELPETGRAMQSGEQLAVVESVKAASDVYSPLAGKVLEANAALEDAPELVNSQPYADGWLVRIQLDDPSALGALLDAAAYAATLEE